jgi:hypothetical protein
MNPSERDLRVFLSALVFLFIIIESHAALADEPRLVIERLEAPEYAVQLEPFPVSIRVTDSVGVEYVDVTFADVVHTVPAEGKLTEHLMVELSRRELGPARIEAVAMGVDGFVGEPVATSVMVVAERIVDVADMSPEEFLVRLDEWERSGMTHLERYERDTFYKEPKLPMQAWDRRYRKYPTQDWVAGNFKKNDLVAVKKNWWLNWKNLGGGQPFDWETQCGGSIPGITPNGEVLRCWLDQNPLVAFSLIWETVDPVTGDVTPRSYHSWTEYQKADLDWAFYVFYVWLEGDLKYNMPIPPDPPFNMIPPEALITPTGLNSQQAWVLYTATVGHSLALEIGGFVPWSVRDYSLNDLMTIFSGARMFKSGKLTYPILENGTQTTATFIGHWIYGVTHAIPTNTFRFFVDNDIIRWNHYYTIARFLQWGRKEMAHYGTFSGEDPTPMEHMYIFWQYYGAPPVVRILEGTPRLWDNHVKSWAKGCSGVSYFLASALRNLNIPAYRLYDADLLGGHSVPVFPSIGHTLSHGDDVYGMKMNFPTMDPSYIPPEEVLLPMATFNQWFYHETHRHNIGRQVYEVAIEYLPNFLMDKYCDDQMSMFHPCLLSVADTFSHIYSCQELFDMGLWERLEEKNQKLKYCEKYWNP